MMNSFITLFAQQHVCNQFVSRVACGCTTVLRRQKPAEKTTYLNTQGQSGFTTHLDNTSHILLTSSRLSSLTREGFNDLHSRWRIRCVRRGENNVAFTLFWGWKCNMWFSLFQHATLLLFRFHGGQIASQSSANIRNLFQILCTCVCMCVCVWQTRGKSSLHNHLKTILISLFSIKKGAKWRRRGRRCRSGGK